MTKVYTRKAYLALFNLLDSRFDKTKDGEVGRLLSGMNPYLFLDDTSADPACFEDFIDCCASYTNDEILNAYNASVDFLKFYCEEFGFEITDTIKDISLEEYSDVLGE